MKCFLPASLAMVVLIAYGIGEGLWTNRWLDSAALAEATARLNQVPLTIGAWEGTDQELDPRQVAQAEMSGYVMRRYVNQQTGAAFSVLLVCGRPGPTALHRPEICYPGAGFNLTVPPTRTPIAAKAQPPLGDFWVGQFQKSGIAPEALRIYYSWNGAGVWHAADSPRLHFAKHAALYKLYVIRQLAAPDEPRKEDPAMEFLQEFLPEIQRALFPAGTVGAQSSQPRRMRERRSMEAATPTTHDGIAFEPQGVQHG